MCMVILPVSMYVYYMPAWYSQNVEEALDLGIGISDN